MGYLPELAPKGFIPCPPMMQGKTLPEPPPKDSKAAESESKPHPADQEPKYVWPDLPSKKS